MQKWEYLQVVLTNRTDGNVAIITNGKGVVANERFSYLYEYLNALGRDGWELVGVGMATNGIQEYHYFKRLIQE